MAKVQMIGGDIKDVKGNTLGEVRAAAGVDKSYQGSINGEVAHDDDEVGTYDFVSFAKKVEGAR